MTIIAYDGKSLAADRQVTYGSTIANYRKKLVKWSGGWWTSTGRLIDHSRFAGWLENRETKFKPHKDFEAIFSENGKVYEVDRDLNPWECPVPHAAGDAGQVALALMRTGYTAEEACNACCDINVFCGGKVDVVHLGT